MKIIARYSIFAVAFYCLSINLYAQDNGANPSAPANDELLEKLESRDQVIDDLFSRIEALERRVRELEGGHTPALAAQSDAQPMPEAAAVVATASSDDLPESDPREQEVLVRRAFEQTLIDRGGLLLPAGVWNLEPSFSYIHSSRDEIFIDGFAIFPVLVVGDIISQQVQRDLNIVTGTARLGLPKDFQIEARLPFGYAQIRTFSADNTEEKLSDTGFGDLELSLSKQLYRSRGVWPDLLASLRWKLATGDNPFRVTDSGIYTGSGYESVGLSLSTVKVVDPVVYFGGLNYTHNFGTYEEIGHFEPGDSWGFNMGMAIALNLNNSLSLAYDHQFSRRSKLDGIGIPDSYFSTGVFSVGSSYTFSTGTTLDLKLGIGLTQDSPDVILSTALPFRGDFGWGR